MWGAGHLKESKNCGFGWKSSIDNTPDNEARTSRLVHRLACPREGVAAQQDSTREGKNADIN